MSQELQIKILEDFLHFETHAQANLANENRPTWQMKIGQLGKYKFSKH